LSEIVAVRPLQKNMRKRIPFKNGEYYHIYNRGVEKREIFLCDFDYFRFFRSLKEFNQTDPVVSLYIKDRALGVRPLRMLQKDEKIVEIISYCLNPNHFHLILKQLKDGGISEFVKRLSGGYTGYFNYKYKRTGVLFQGKFKSIHIDSNEYLLYLSAYVNGNYIIHKIDDKKWRFSSLNSNDGFSNLKLISDQFKNADDYKRYVYSVAKQVREKREEMKKYLLE